MKPFETCQTFRESLIDLHYGLLDAGRERECRAHLASCEGCAGELEGLKRLGAAMAPHPGDAFGREQSVDWDRFARTTVQRAIAATAEGDADAPVAPPHTTPGWFGIASTGVSAWLESLRLPAMPGWVAAAAGLVMVVGIGALTLNYLPVVGTGPATTVAQSDDVIMPKANLDNLTVNLARQNTAEYLKQTRAVLVSMMDVNIDCEKGKVDVSAERNKATELLRRQRLIAAELNRMPLARAQDVCDDLEKLLMEVASLGDCARDDEIKTIRDVVEKRQILVRMELLTQELARRDGAHV